MPKQWIKLKEENMKPKINKKSKTNETKLFIYFTFLKNPKQRLTSGEICKMLKDKLGITNRRGIVNHLSWLKEKGYLDYVNGSYGLPKNWKDKPEKLVEISDMCMKLLFPSAENAEAFLYSFGLKEWKKGYEEDKEEFKDSKDEDFDPPKKPKEYSPQENLVEYLNLLVPKEVFKKMDKIFHDRFKKHFESKEYKEMRKEEIKEWFIMNMVKDKMFMDLLRHSGKWEFHTEGKQKNNCIKNCEVAEKLIKNGNISRRQKAILEFLLNVYKSYGYDKESFEEEEQFEKEFRLAKKKGLIQEETIGSPKDYYKKPNR